jgi:hypothetical protein
MCGQISVKLPIIDFHENPFIRSRIATCDRWVNGQTDMAELIDACLQLLVVNAPEEHFLLLALRDNGNLSEEAGPSYDIRNRDTENESNNHCTKMFVWE